MRHEPAEAVQKGLRRAARRDVVLSDAVDELKASVKLMMQRFWGVPRDRQSAALQRPVFGERRDKHVPARPHRPPHLRDIGRAIGCVRQEVKHRPVVPEVVCGFGQRGVQHVVFEPLYAGRGVSQSRARLREGRR